MKNILKSALVMCVALTMGLVGCQNDPVVDGGDKNVKNVTIKIAKSDLTRAAGSTAAKVEMSTVDVFFTTGDAIVEAGVFAADDIAAGFKVFTGLTATINQVHVIGNMPTGLATGITTISALLAKAEALTLENQADLADVALYGSDTALDDTTAPDADVNELTAEVEVAPVVARFEIGAISSRTAEDAGEGDHIVTSYTIEEIYLDGVYTDMSFDGTKHDALTLTGSDDVAWYAGDTNHEPQVWDAVGLDSDNQIVAYEVPAEGEGDPAPGVWGYTLLPAAGAKLPVLVFKLSNIVINGDDTTSFGEEFYYLTAATTEADDAIEGGFKYQVENLVFDAGDLTPLPNQKPINVKVIVTVADWVPAPVEYTFE
jgi:hypothetical protein